ncbi:MAG: hypothetical protein R2695_18185 [Acidimicrobiales bacterium]
MGRVPRLPPGHTGARPAHGHDVVFEIDVYGAEQIRMRYPDALLVFVDAPSQAHQEERLRGRGDPDDKVAARLAKAEDEVAMARSLGSVFVVNDDLDKAVAGRGADRLVSRPRRRLVG